MDLQQVWNSSLQYIARRGEKGEWGESRVGEGRSGKEGGRVYRKAGTESIKDEPAVILRACLISRVDLFVPTLIKYRTRGVLMEFHSNCVVLDSVSTGVCWRGEKGLVKFLSLSPMTCGLRKQLTF